jgi:hypothetical protein
MAELVKQAQFRTCACSYRNGYHVFKHECPYGVFPVRETRSKGKCSYGNL